MRLKRCNFDAVNIRKKECSGKIETHNWHFENLPPPLTFWVFRTCRMKGEGCFHSSQYPCNFTLRMVTAGRGIYRMKKSEWEIEYGDIFISVPGVSFELSEAQESPLEWYELQIEGPDSFKIMSLSGCSEDIPVKSLANPKKSIRLFRLLHDLYASPERRVCRAMASFWRLMDSVSPSSAESGKTPAQPAEILVSKVKLLLGNSHFAISLNIEEIASRYFNVDRSSLFRAFKRVEGISPKNFLLNMRLCRAKELLATEMTICEIAHASGFRDEKYFINFFRKRIGVSPERWRRTQMKKMPHSDNEPEM